MLFIVMTIRDRAVDTYMSPMFARSENEATRQFNDAINNNDTQNPLYKHPEDYDLYRLGTYDDQTGEFHNEPRPHMVITGKECKNARQQEPER